MARYMTAQRKSLLDFFENNPDKQFSAKQITDALCTARISQSAVYRNLSLLTEEGLLCCRVNGSSGECFYQYINHHSCKNALHLTCTQCGEITHMDDSLLDNIEVNLWQKDGFFVDKAKTVLFGLCKNCSHNL